MDSQATTVIVLAIHVHTCMHVSLRITDCGALPITGQVTGRGKLGGEGRGRGEVFVNQLSISNCVPAVGDGSVNVALLMIDTG